ncbi:unnamed protein product [Mytilus coruscus]|uniref:Uncharacterized protein n=1 Tax=Mytilus coruscus TaxID=42192 RepID=A0A6J8BM34_MYTCO|nr:unnamed protein product [Mytilus coruscus]
MQKRYLNDDLRHLHEKFYSEFPEHPVSYSMFCKCRPFWIVKPSTKDRETCLCIKHENIHYLIEKLYQSQLITTKRVETFIDNICCDIANKNCMYRQCNICEKKEVEMNEQDLTQQVSWYKWCTRREEKVKNDSTVTISTTVKVEETGVLGHLIDEFQESLKKFCYHYFNIVHQYQALKRLKENLNDNEVVIHMDFSENFNCKYEKKSKASILAQANVPFTTYWFGFCQEQHNLIVQSRHVSCFCKKPEPCDCFGVSEFQFDKSNATNIQSDSLDQSVIGKWCIVTYDNKPYPGIIQDIDANECEVEVMHRIGENRFYWPMVQDIVWYHHSNFVTLIDSPTKVGSRHYEVDKKVWKRVKDDLGI